MSFGQAFVGHHHLRGTRNSTSLERHQTDTNLVLLRVGTRVGRGRIISRIISFGAREDIAAATLVKREKLKGLLAEVLVNWFLSSRSPTTRRQPRPFSTLPLFHPRVVHDPFESASPAKSWDRFSAQQEAPPTMTAILRPAPVSLYHITLHWAPACILTVSHAIATPTFVPLSILSPIIPSGWWLSGEVWETSGFRLENSGLWVSSASLSAFGLDIERARSNIPRWFSRRFLREVWKGKRTKCVDSFLRKNAKEKFRKIVIPFGVVRFPDTRLRWFHEEWFPTRIFFSFAQNGRWDTNVQLIISVINCNTDMRIENYFLLLSLIS